MLTQAHGYYLALWRYKYFVLSLFLETDEYFNRNVCAKLQLCFLVIVSIIIIISLGDIAGRLAPSLFRGIPALRCIVTSAGA